MARLAAIPVLIAAALSCALASAQDLSKPENAVRIATFNLSLARGEAGKLTAELRAGGGRQIDALAEIIQRVRPDILFLNELDYDPAQEALALFAQTLAASRNGAGGIDYAHRFSAPVNTGLRSGFDLDGDGRTSGPNDAQGWGVFEGQFGMALLSRYPIETIRTFQRTRWAALPWAAPPQREDGAPFYAPEVWAALRLSSKSHWDAGVRLPGGALLHVLASHPTPPVFDGKEDRNGLRNAAEILFWRDYIDGADWIADDDGRPGGLPDGAAFVIVGDLNNDPVDGDGVHGAVWALLDHPRIQNPAPRSLGGAEAAALQGGVNAEHQGDPGRDTADWRDEAGEGPGNLRVDYVLPSSDLTVLGSGVFWPAAADPLARLVGEGFPVVSSDHRLVWVDVAIEVD